MELKCMDCETPYRLFPLDVVVSDEIWARLSGRTDGSGVLCPWCIVERGSKLPGVTVAKLVFE